MERTDRRLPVIGDPEELEIPWRTLRTIIGGHSLIDAFELHVRDLVEAQSFLHTYGIRNQDEAAMLLETSRHYIEDVLLRDTGLGMPARVYGLDLPRLLVTASDPEQSHAAWCGVVLKVCHAVAHARWTRDEEAYEAARAELEARLKPWLQEERDGTWIGDDHCRIPLAEYRFKTGKDLFRVVTKLLLKEGNLSSGIYDHLGVRFVTLDMFSAVLLVRFLRSRNILMYANVLPQASKNSLAELREIERLFGAYSADFSPDPEELDKANAVSINPYSSRRFRMIKFVERMLVETPAGRITFFPCEFQLLTRKTFEDTRLTRADHAIYERRQAEGVRRRLFRFLPGWHGDRSDPVVPENRST